MGHTAGWPRNAGLGNASGSAPNWLGLVRHPAGGGASSRHRILTPQAGSGGAQLAYGGGHHLDAPLQAVFQVPAGRVICEEGKAGVGRRPHARLLVQPLEELIHCGRAVKTHHLPGEGTS